MGHPLGVAIAFSFVTVLLIIIIWMLRLPKPAPPEAVKAIYSVEAVRRILVPIIEGVYSERAVELACRLGERQNAHIILLHVIEVPYTVPLDAPLPELEKKGRKALETANFIALQHGFKPEVHLIRHRSASEGILSLARQSGVDQIIMGIGLKKASYGEGIGRTVREVLRRANCEVIISKIPIGG